MAEINHNATITLDKEDIERIFKDHITQKFGINTFRTEFVFEEHEDDPPELLSIVITISDKEEALKLLTPTRKEPNKPARKTQSKK
jgi:hypothetical protein